MSPVGSKPATSLLEEGEDILAATCHKLRTPLTAALGFLQLAQRDARRAGIVSSSHLDMVDQQLRRMARLLDELGTKSASH